MSTFWKYTITIFCLLALFGVHFLSFSYPYLALGIYLIWVGITIFGVNIENKTDTELRKQLENTLKLSKDTIEELEKTTKYKNYLEILSAQMLMKLQEIDSTITPEKILKEFFNNAERNKEKV